MAACLRVVKQKQIAFEVAHNLSVEMACTKDQIL